MQFTGGNGLQFAAQNIRVGIAAGNKRAQRANHRGEEDVGTAGQIDNRLGQRGDNPAEIHHRGQRDNRHNRHNGIFKLENGFDKYFQHPACGRSLNKTADKGRKDDQHPRRGHPFNFQRQRVAVGEREMQHRGQLGRRAFDRREQR